MLGISKKYEIINHTADIGIKVYGKDLKELFANAAFGMFEIIARLENVKTKKLVKLNLKAPNIEELLVSWLRELLYQYNAKEILFKEFTIEQLSENQIEAKAQGERFDPQKHELKTEVKAVTYHELKVEQAKDGWQAEVIFDV